MHGNYVKKVKILLCWCCIFSLCITSTAMAQEILDGVYFLADGSLAVRTCDLENHTITICEYSSPNSQNRELYIPSKFILVDPDRVVYTDENGNQIDFYVIGIEDEVFAGNHNFTYINVQLGTGITIGKSAFEDVQVKSTFSLIGGYKEKGADIKAEEIIEIGEYAFAESNIKGNLTIGEMNGSIRTGAFKNLKLTGKLDISGTVYELEDYSLSGMSISGISLPAIYHMGDGVYKDTPMGEGVTMPLSNSLKTIGSRVFEGTNLAAVKLPESDTVEYAAEDAFEEGMLIIIPEGLTNLEVFHFDKYQNLTFQTAENLSDDSPVIQYLKENRLVYKKGANGDPIYPEAVDEPTDAPQPTDIPSPTDSTKPTDTPSPTDTAQPTDTPTPTDSTKPTDTPSPTHTAQPTDTPSPTHTTKPTDTPSPTHAAHPIDTPMPAGTTKPTNTSSPTDSTKPMDTLSPADTIKPTDTPSPMDTTKPTGTQKPADTLSPVWTPSPTDTPNSTDAAQPSDTTQSTNTPGPTESTQLTDTPMPQLSPNPTDTPQTTDTPAPPPAPNATDNTTQTTDTPAPPPAPNPTDTTQATSTPAPLPTPNPTDTIQATSTPAPLPTPNSTGTIQTTDTPMPAETGSAGGDSTEDGSSNGESSLLNPVSTPNAESTADSFTISISEAEEVPVATQEASDKTDQNDIYSVGKLNYRLLGKNKVAVTGAKKKNCTSISIPETVTINKKLYKVVRIEKQAFKGIKKLKNVKTGNNVRKIENQAFAKCSKLESIQFGTGLVNVGKKVLYQDKNMLKIVFKGTKLKTIGQKTFSGIKPEKVTIKVKKSKLKAYQKLINNAK